MLATEAAIGLSGGCGEVEEAEISDASAPGGGEALEIHPLEHQWTFWFDSPSACPPQATWGTAIRPIHTFGTVEDFWGLYNNINQINRPSKLPVGANLYCFKKDIEPKWEDPICATGGKWAIISARGNPGRNDTWWLYTLLPMIGEQFNHGDEICGAVVNIRVKNERISIWTKNGLNEAAQEIRVGGSSGTVPGRCRSTVGADTEEYYTLVKVSIGKQWKEFLDYNGSIGFILHDDAKRHMRAAKDHYMV